MKSLLFIFLTVAFLINAQDKNPYDLLDKVKAGFENIEDYEVNATIRIDVNFLKMPDSKAKIYFKKPDKVKLKSDGFAMLPKKGVNFSPAALLNGDYDALYTGTSEVEGVIYDVVKVIPKGDSSDVILTTLKINPELNVISYVESTTKNAGSFSVAVKYEKIKDYQLPSEVVLSFNMGDIQIPKAAAAQFDNDKENTEKGKKEKDQMTGSVTITYTDYKVNVGLSDEIFEDEKK